MRIIVFFIALLAIPVVQVAFAPRLERAVAPVFSDRSIKILIAVGKQLRTRDIKYPEPTVGAATEGELTHQSAIAGTLTRQ